jgi:DNA primase
LEGFKMPSVDFQELKRRCKTVDFLRVRGWTPNEQSALELRGWCPIHSAPNPRSRSFWVRVSDGWWYCHVCKTGGSVLDLALHLLAPVVLDAARDLCFLLNVDVPYIARSPVRWRPRNRKRNGGGVRGAEPSDSHSGQTG